MDRREGIGRWKPRVGPRLRPRDAPLGKVQGVRAGHGGDRVGESGGRERDRGFPDSDRPLGRCHDRRMEGRVERGVAGFVGIDRDAYADVASQPRVAQILPRLQRRAWKNIGEAERDVGRVGPGRRLRFSPATETRQFHAGFVHVAKPGDPDPRGVRQVAGELRGGQG